MDDDAPCCGACAHAAEVEARGGPRSSTAPLLHVPVVDGVPHGAELVILVGHELGRTIAIDRTELVFGRSAGVDVRIHDSVISRRQCRVLCRDGHVLVEDLGSACGTYVDDHKVDRAALHEGQRILVGNTIFQVRRTGG